MERGEVIRTLRFTLWGVIGLLSLLYLVPLVDAVDAGEYNPFPLALLADGSLGSDDEEVFPESIANQTTTRKIVR